MWALPYVASMVLVIGPAVDLNRTINKLENRIKRLEAARGENK